MLLRVHFVRHGETHANQQRRVQGQRDDADQQLSERGRTQSQQLAERLAIGAVAPPIAAIYTSDLGRAVGTALLVQQQQPASSAPPLLCDARLRERSMGLREGRRWRRHRPRCADVRDDEAQDGCESPSSLRERMLGALRDIVRAHGAPTDEPSAAVVIVSHLAALEALFGYFGELLADTSRLRNASLSTLDIALDRDELALRAVLTHNSTEHLDDHALATSLGASTLDNGSHERNVDGDALVVNPCTTDARVGLDNVLSGD